MPRDRKPTIKTEVIRIETLCNTCQNARNISKEKIFAELSLLIYMCKDIIVGFLKGVTPIFNFLHITNNKNNSVKSQKYLMNLNSN